MTITPSGEVKLYLWNPKQQIHSFASHMTINPSTNKTTEIMYILYVFFIRIYIYIHTLLVINCIMSIYCIYTVYN